MPCAIPDAKRTRIQVKLELTQSSKQIAKDTNVSRRAVQRFTKNIRDYGTPKPPKLVPQGRPRKITPEIEEVCPHRHHEFLTLRLSSTTFLHVLPLTLASKFTSFGIHSMSR